MEAKLDTVQAPKPATAPTLELGSPVTLTSPTPKVVDAEFTDAAATSLTVSTSATPATTTVTEVVLDRPKHLTADGDHAIQQKVSTFVAAIRANPSDMSFANEIMKLGDRANAVVVPNSRLFEASVREVMDTQKDGSSINRNLLAIKAALDRVNPAVVAERETTKMGGLKGLLGKVRKLLPEEVLTVIAGRRDTVKSTIDDLKLGLYEGAEGLTRNIVDLQKVYEQLQLADAMVAEDIYLAQLLLAQLNNLIATLEPGYERENVETLAADTAKRIMDLQAERAANQQFFLGSQGMARLTRQQLTNIKSLMGLLERSVLANLGLRVVAVAMGQSLAVTSALSKTIGDTIADTGTMINQQGTAMTAARSTANIDLDGLRRGCTELEKFFEQQATANQKIIAQGMQVNAELSGMVRRLEVRTAGGSPGQLLGGGQAPALTQR